MTISSTFPPPFLFFNGISFYCLLPLFSFTYSSLFSCRRLSFNNSSLVEEDVEESGDNIAGDAARYSCPRLPICQVSQCCQRNLQWIFRGVMCFGGGHSLSLILKLLTIDSEIIVKNETAKWPLGLQSYHIVPIMSSPLQ